MAYVKEYWAGKEKRAKQAREHTRDMQERYNEMLKAEPNSPLYLTLECVIADIESQPTVCNLAREIVKSNVDVTGRFKEFFGSHKEQEYGSSLKM